MKPRYSGILLALGTLCRAWQATFGDATQCGDMSVSWNGTAAEKLGPPFVVRLAAFGLAPLTIDIPTTAWSDASRSGSYSFNIPWPAGTNFVAAMDDGFGAGKGGVTGIQTVNPSSDSSCITTSITQPDHVFDVSGTFVQCSVVTMNWTEPATTSTLITGLVPNGIAFQLDPPVTNSKSTTWNLNIPGGTAFALVYVPPSGSGLTSRLLVSQEGNNDGCLGSGAYPSATATQTGVRQATNSASPSASSGATGSSSPNLGAIVGATLGAVAFLLSLLVLAFCWYRRRQQSTRFRSESISSGKEINLESNDGGLGNAHGRTATHQRDLPEGAVVLPFVLPSVSSTQETPTTSSRKQPVPSNPRSATARRTSRETFTTSAGESSSGGPTSSGRQARSETEDGEPVFIQHADSGRVPVQPRAREVIELPPNYDQLPRSLPRQPGGSDQVRGYGYGESQRKI